MVDAGGSEEEEGEPSACPNGHATLAGRGGGVVGDDGGSDDDAAADAAAAGAALPPAAVAVSSVAPTCISFGDNDKRAHGRHAKAENTCNVLRMYAHM